MKVEKNEDGSYKILVSFLPRKPGETGRRYTTLVAKAGNVKAPLKVYESISFLVIIDNGKKILYEYETNRNYNSIDSGFLKNCYLVLDKLYEGAGNIIIGDKKVNIVREVIKNIYREVYIKRLPDFSSSVYNPDLHTIFFNPNIGISFHLEIQDGVLSKEMGYNSPVAIFGHEMIHVYNDLLDHENYLLRKEKQYMINKHDPSKLPFNDGFPNEEEVYTTDLSNQINENLNETKRNNYSANDIKVSDVFSIK
ncbi:hypothetical protein ETU10_10555 [Apibacter muscae]|uniref:hypothetical protein n=1 Tax=Apibacter muscae TaxID=2509004 RepID=UPI0011ACD7E7|nr:hypothetical protein [Apibacter muscae]TWP22507.1 hypothetical protein ETU10_10555 [Apibacter muscae]